MVPLSSVNLLVKTLCSYSALLDESLVIVPLLFCEAPIAGLKLNLLLYSDGMMECTYISNINKTLFVFSHMSVDCYIID